MQKERSATKNGQKTGTHRSDTWCCSFGEISLGQGQLDAASPTAAAAVASLFRPYWPPEVRLDAGSTQGFWSFRRRQLDLFNLFPPANDLSGRNQDVLDVAIGLVEVALQLADPVAQQPNIVEHL